MGGVCIHVITANVITPQISSGPNFRQWGNPVICEQHVRDEKNGRSGLRRHLAGCSSLYYSPLSLLTISFQCAIPAFEGLFPASHDVIVQTILYRFAQWHALAKLRIHSDSTLGFLDETFKVLSKQLRKFRDITCTAFTTLELPKEKAARQHRIAKSNNAPSDSSAPEPRVKKFNLNTYKFHSMGDYVRTIKLFGTTDSFTTQIVGISSFLALKYLKSPF